MLQRWLRRLLFSVLLVLMVILPARIAHGPEAADAAQVRPAVHVAGGSITPAAIVIGLVCLLSLAGIYLIRRHRPN